MYFQKPGRNSKNLKEIQKTWGNFPKKPMTTLSLEIAMWFFNYSSFICLKTKFISRTFYWIIFKQTQLCSLFERLNVIFKCYISEKINSLGISNNGGPQHGLVNADLAHYETNINVRFYISNLHLIVWSFLVELHFSCLLIGFNWTIKF